MTKKQPIKFEVSLPPMSVNEIYRVSRYGKIYKTNEARKWENDFFLLLPKPREWWARERKRKCALGLQLLFYVPSVDNFDLDNQLKLLIDVLQKKYKFDDRWIHYIEVAKYESEEFKICGQLFFI